MANLKMSKQEVDVAGPIVHYLTEQGWDVYQEVDVGKIADIVAISGNRVWIIEVKTGFSLDLLQQASNWETYANWVSIAFLRPKRGIKSIVFQICQWKGIGIFTTDYFWNDGVNERLPAHINRRTPMKQYVLNALHEEQKTHAVAGDANGRRWSPFKATTNRIRCLLQTQDGIRLKDAVDQIEHHYANDTSAKQSIVQAIQRGWITGIRYDGGKLYADKTGK